MWLLFIVKLARYLVFHFYFFGNQPWTLSYVAREKNKRVLISYW